MKLATFLSLLTSFFLFQSCDFLSTEPQKASDFNGKYYDLSGLVEQLTQDLEKDNPTVTKTVILNGEKELMKDTVSNWGKELALFKDADINQPVFDGAYEAKTSESQQLFIPLNPGSVKVQKLLVEEVDSKPSHIFIEAEEENILFTSTRTMELFLKNGKLIAYSVKARQAINFGSTTEYEVVGKVGRN